MNFSVLNRRLGALPPMLAALVLGATAAHAGGHGEKIEFSDPDMALVASNLTEHVTPALNRLNPTPNAFKQVQEDLFRPLTESIKNVNSMDGVLNLPPPPEPQSSTPQSKHTREALDRQRNWAFTDLNDLYPEPSVEEVLGVRETGDDGREKPSVSQVEKYLAAGERHHGGTNQNRVLEIYQATGIMMTNGYGLNDANLPIQYDFLKAKNPFAASDKDSSASAGLFGDASPAESASEDARAQQLHRDQYLRLLDPSLPPVKTGNNPYLTGNFGDLGLRQPGVFGDANQNNNGSLQAATAAAAAPVHRDLTGGLGQQLTDPTAAALHSRVFDNPTDVALGLHTPPPLQAAPPPVTAESIQAILNPYGAVLKKPGF